MKDKDVFVLILEEFDFDSLMDLVVSFKDVNWFTVLLSYFVFILS